MFLYSARDISSSGFGEGVMRNLEPSRKVTPSQGFKSERKHVFGMFTFLQKWLKGFGSARTLSGPFVDFDHDFMVNPAFLPVVLGAILWAYHHKLTCVENTRTLHR